MSESTEDWSITPLSLRGFVAGAFSGMAKTVVGHPFDTIKVRMQIDGNKFGSSPLQCLRDTVRKESFLALYKGAAAPLIGWGLMDVIMVGTYFNVINAFDLRGIDHPAAAFIAGTIGGYARSFVACPVELVKTRLQIQYADPTTIKYAGTIDCLRQMYRAHGIRGIYQGYTGTLFFSSFLGIYFWANDIYRKWIDQQNLNISSGAAAFMSGGMAANTLWMIAYPADRVKNLLMTQPRGTYTSIWHCMSTTVRREGIRRGLYTGFLPCILRSFPANGMAWFAVDAIMKFLPISEEFKDATVKM